VYTLSQAASNRVGDEILIFSDELDFFESIKVLKSPVLV
jgi:DNA adenine methylase